VKYFSKIFFSSVPFLVFLGLTGCISVASTSSDKGQVSANGLFLESMEWGRLVDIYDANNDLIETNALINHEVVADVNIELLTNAVTRKESVKIQFAQGTIDFNNTLNTLKSSLQSVNRLDIDAPPPYGLVARNATLRLNFSQQIDPASVDLSSIQVKIGDEDENGNRAMLPFLVRYIVQNDASSNTGAVLLDPTVSAIEAAAEQVPLNVVGFDASIQSSGYNMMIEIPTRVDLINGVSRVLSSLDGRYGPSRKSAGEPAKALGLDNYTLVAAMRTGNEFDAYSGFMRDVKRPELIGVQGTTVQNIVNITSNSAEFEYSVDATNCADLTPKIGDVFEVDELGVNTIWTVDAVLDSAGPVYRVRCDIDVSDSSNFIAPFPAKLTTRYSPLDYDIQACYLEILPEPVLNLPVGGILPEATVTVRFDEPLDPSSVRSMSTFCIIQPDDNPAPDPLNVKESQTAWFRQVDTLETVGDFIDRQRGYDYRADAAGSLPDSEFGGRILFGQVIATNSNRDFSITPLAGWQDADPNDTSNSFVIALRDGAEGLKDLSGNALLLNNFVAGNDGAGLPAQNIQLSILGAPADGSKYFSLLGKSLDEDGDSNAEWAGQVSILSPGILSGRPPSRFTVSADNGQFSLSSHISGTPEDNTAVQEPLTFAGAVVMNVYRPEDFGFGYGLVDEYNLTVEGFSWSPYAGVTYDEDFPSVSLSLSHSLTLPDEAFVAVPPGPIWPQSGMATSSFDDNVLGYTQDGSSGIDEQLVFNNSYYVRSVNKFDLNGVEYLPWPEFTENYVWRDTSMSQEYLGGTANSIGSPTQQYVVDNPGFPVIWAPEQVPSIGLPLQCRFRTDPSANLRQSLNTFATTVMMNPANQPPNLPMFRIYSAGGQDASGNWQQVKPDVPGTSGFLPTGGYINGIPTANVGDDIIYWAAADIVKDTSRMYSHWFDTSGPLNLGAFKGVIVEPSPELQPKGTSISVEYRGAVAVSAGGVDPDVSATPLNSADTPFDEYGDFVGTGTVSTPSAWTEDITDLEGQSYSFIQIRVTFKSNPDLGLRPELDSLGIVWTN
jgi:hypothetical protein